MIMCETMIRIHPVDKNKLKMAACQRGVTMMHLLRQMIDDLEECGDYRRPHTTGADDDLVTTVASVLAARLLRG